MKKVYIAISLMLLAGCAVLVQRNFDELFGQSDPTRYDVPMPPLAGSMSFRKDVQPILDKRCVVCHACYDAPCQLKLSSWEGVARGSNQDPVYNGTRLLEAAPSRLFVDADKTSDWRTRGFSPVLNEHAPSPVANLEASTMSRMLRLKTQHPLSGDAILPGSFDFSLDRAQQCAKIENFDSFEQNFPQWGMPFGLPGLTTQQTDTLQRWLAQGAPYEGPEPLSMEDRQQVERWEHFFNADTLKAQLVNRYIYEHLFLAHLYFSDNAKLRFFKLVRSTTPPGVPIKIIPSRRPFDDPGVAHVYYRLTPEQESISLKTHMPYALNAERMERWRVLFLSDDYKVDKLPGYAPELASNPFITFDALPLSSRYRFMLDEAEFTIMGFIKGPVCRGQTALNVIDDHFWVFFVSPDLYDIANTDFFKQEGKTLALPAEHESNSLVITPTLEYAQLESRYLSEKSKALEAFFDTPGKLKLNLFWDGDGHNPNAALTVYRHFDSATVLKGMVGEAPKTSWLMTYPLLERIHYLLVAGYDVYGNIGHQLNTRLYMDYLREEGEYNFLITLPQASRIPLRDYWYRKASDSDKQRVYGRIAHFDRETDIRFQTDKPQQELYGMLHKKLDGILPHAEDLDSVADSSLRADLKTLASVRGKALAQMPELAFLRIDSANAPPRYFTLLRNTGHYNVTHLLTESEAILPEEHSLDVVPGFVGAYPNAIYRIDRRELSEFTAAITGLQSDKDYQVFMSRFGVRRTNPDFWAVSDALHEAQARISSVEAGLFDYNRLENR